MPLAFTPCIHDLATLAKNAAYTAAVGMAAVVASALNAHAQTNTPLPMVKIEIWSDVACPFCYIGQAHLKQALDKIEGATGQVVIEWKSFILDPSLPEDTDLDIYQSLSERKGIPMAQVRQMTKRVELMARQAGLEVDIARARPVSTRRAHQLLQYAKAQGKGDEMKTALFKAYFAEGAQIARKETLLSIGHSVGLSADEVEQALSEAQYALSVDADVAESRQLGVTGVPFFVVNRNQAISGAQPPEVLRRVVEDALAAHAEKLQNETAGGGHCAPDENCK